MNFDELYIRMAMLVAQKSKDESTKIGCVIVSQDNTVLSTGFNGFPRGVKEVLDGQPIAERWARPTKYSIVEHAERNAVYNAARNGVKLLGAKAYLNIAPTPCADCCRGLIQAGITEIIGPNIPFTGVGVGNNYHLDYSEMMCKEAGVIQRVVMWDFI